MASNENQKALDNLYDYAEMGCSTWDSKKDNESISKSKQALQQAIDELELYKKALDDMSLFIFDYRINHNLYHKNKTHDEKFYKKCPSEIKEMFVEEAREELNNAKQD